MRTPRHRPEAGSTLIELVVVLAISSLLVALVVAAMIDFDRARRPRELTAQLQGEGRAGLLALENDLRAGSLGAPTGIISAQLDGAATNRPAVQVFEKVPGGGFLNVKPGTDALLIVRAEMDGGTSPVTATVGDLYAAGSLQVTSSDGFADDDFVLYGPYADAVWDQVTLVAAGRIDTAGGADVFPGSPQGRKLPAGSFVRRAHARLYFVTTGDDLVRAELAAPRTPQSAAEVVDVLVLAKGVENLQLDCVTDDGVDVGGCPGTLVDRGYSVDAIVSETGDALGAAVAGTGPRFRAEEVASLRSLTMAVAIRSQSPVANEHQGDPVPTVNEETIGAGAETPYLRRVYRIGIAVRNTSLGVL